MKHIADEVLKLGDALKAGVAGTDKDEREVLAARVAALERLGYLERAHHPVAQPDRLGERLEPDGVLGETGNGQRPADGADRDDEVVVGELLGFTL